jgi:hypothetical protein
MVVICVIAAAAAIGLFFVDHNPIENSEAKNVVAVSAVEA